MFRTNQPPSPASFRYDSAPDFRQLALLDGIRVVLTAHGPRSLGNDGIEACLPMLLRGIDSSNSGIVQAATDIMLVRQASHLFLCCRWH